MNWYQDLYTGNTAKKQKKQIIRKINADKIAGNVYLITLAANPENELDIVPAFNLKFSYIKRSCPMIVGIALGRQEALDVVQTIVSEAYQAMGVVRIREYLEKKVH